jgi:hypothetical protein
MVTVEQLPEGPGLVGFRLAATGSAGLDWQRLDETWALAGELDAFDAGWMSDHLSDASRERGGPAFEAVHHRGCFGAARPGQMGRHRRCGQYLPTSGRDGQGGHRAR